MKNIKKIFVSIISALMILSLVGCGSSTSTSQSAQPTKEEKPVTLNISAAASLKDAMGDIQKEYAKSKPNVTLTINFGASGTLEQQIIQGAPCDLFISAASKQVDDLKSKSLLVDDSVVNFLGNKIVLIVPKDKSDVTGFDDLTTDKVKKLAVGEPKSVPVGQYSLEIFKNKNITDKVQSKEVLGKDVKEVLSYVETGNADAGLVYETDAKTSDKVKVVATADESTHSPVVYPMAIIKASQNVDDTKAFQKFLQGDKAKKIFEKYGFSVK
ncbi:MAG: molybdate ABC transporter substrate-binding protein [Bacillota bacterium]|nr:molybdate ABC transporter substrate-binding protein [Bacillota bacterium]